MDDIIDDCLRCILERLPLHDRLRLEIVCRKWFQLMPYSNVTAFALDDVPWPDRHVHELSYEHNNLKFSQPVMQPRRFCRYMNFLLDRIGPHLRTLSLAPRRISFRPLVTPELAQLIADLCTNVTSIILTSCILESSATDQLARLRHLSYINLSTAVFLEDNRLNLVNHQVLSAKLDALLSTLRLERLNLAHCPFVVAIKSDNSAKTAIAGERTELAGSGHHLRKLPATTQHRSQRMSQYTRLRRHRATAHAECVVGERLQTD